MNIDLVFEDNKESTFFKLLTIVLGLPAFDWMYLKDFKGRLSLSDAQASWKDEGPLGNIECRSFVAGGNLPVMVVHYEDELSESVV